MSDKKNSYYEHLKSLDVKSTQPVVEDLVPDEEVDSYIEKAKLREKYDSQDLRTLAESTASAASLGLTDHILTGLKISTPEELKLRREHNPIMNVTGQIAGTVAPALLSGGSSLGAKIASKLPTSLASKIGSKVTAGMKEVLKDKAEGSFAKRIIANNLPSVAGSAVEGSIYGIGELISENALGNKDFNAETAIQHALYGAALGAGASGLFSAGAKAAKGGKSLISKGGSNVSDAYSKLVGTTPKRSVFLKNKYGDKLDDIAKNNATILKESGDLKIFTSSKKLGSAALDKMESKGSEIGDIIDNLSNSGVVITKKSIHDKNISKLDDLVKNQLRDKMPKKDFDQLEKSLNDPAIKYSSKNSNRIIREAAKVDPYLRSDIDELAKLRKMEVEAFKASGDVAYNAKMIQNDKKNIDTLLKKVYNNADNKTDLTEKFLLGKREVLKDEINSIASQVPDEQIKSRLLKANKDYHDLKIFEREYEKLSEKDVSLLDNVLQKDSMVFAAGSLLGIPDLIGTGIAINKIVKSDAMKRLNVLKSIEQSSVKTQQKIESGIKQFFKSKAQSLKSPSSKILIDSVLSNVEGSKPKTDDEAIDNMRQNLSELTNDPNKMLNTVSRFIGPYQDSAPDTAAHMVDILTKKITYLQSKLPPAKYDNGIISKFDKKKPSLSSIEVAKIKRIVNTMENPTSVLDDLQSGTITREQVEVLQNIYPNIYEEIQSQTMKYVAKNPDLEYQQKINLGILLNLPTDRSITQKMIQQLQLSYVNEQENQPQTQGKYSALTNENIKTPVQETEES